MRPLKMRAAEALPPREAPALRPAGGRAWREPISARNPFVIGDPYQTRQSDTSKPLITFKKVQKVTAFSALSAHHEMPSETSTAGTPLAPSVEKAYYRKCIALKRRLNEVEVANDEAKLRRVRLDRAIMKMRLERAFLLDELRRRMDVNVDGSEGSGDEGMATPPQDRPHRDKRRRTTQAHATGASFEAQGTGAEATNALQPGIVPKNEREENGGHSYGDAEPRPLPLDNPYSSQQHGPISENGRPSSRANGVKMDSAADEEVRATSEQHSIANGGSAERRLHSSTSADDTHAESDRRRDATARPGSTGFTAANSR